MEENTVELSQGKVVLRRPTAGARNKAMISAVENGTLNNVKMMVELLPLCIKEHPWKTQNVKHVLDSLDFAQYDLIVDGLKKLMQPEDTEEDIKKSEASSEANPETPETQTSG